MSDTNSTQNHYDTLDAEVVMPENFAMVCPGVYRSSFPRSKSITFLHRLGKVVCLYDKRIRMIQNNLS